MNSAVKVIFFDLGVTLVRSPRAWLPGAKALLNSLHANGFRLGIISNTTGLQDRQAIFELLPIDFDLNRFDASIVLFSSEVDTEKPGAEIFEEAIRRAHSQPSECLYCSENIVETLVAQHVGMRSIRVQSAPNSDLASIESVLAEFASLI